MMTRRSRFLAIAATSALALAAPAHADTLREALAEAYRTNPTLQAARAQLRATDETVAIEKADARPNVNGQAALTEYVKKSSTSFFSPDRALTAGVDLGVPLYSGGSVKNCESAICRLRNACRRAVPICVAPKARSSARSWPLTWTSCAAKRWWD